MTAAPEYQRGNIVQMSDGRIGRITALWWWTCTTAPDASHWRIKIVADGNEWQHRADEIRGRAKIKPVLRVIHGSPVAPRYESEPPSAA